MQEVLESGDKRPWQIIEAENAARDIAESLAKPEVKQVRVRRLTSSERRKIKRQQYKSERSDA